MVYSGPHGTASAKCKENGCKSSANKNWCLELILKNGAGQNEANLLCRLFKARSMEQWVCLCESGYHPDKSLLMLDGPEPKLGMQNGASSIPSMLKVVRWKKLWRTVAWGPEELMPDCEADTNWDGSNMTAWGVTVSPKMLWKARR